MCIVELTEVQTVVQGRSAAGPTLSADETPQRTDCRMHNRPFSFFEKSYLFSSLLETFMILKTSAQTLL